MLAAEDSFRVQAGFASDVDKLNSKRSSGNQLIERKYRESRAKRSNEAAP